MFETFSMIDFLSGGPPLAAGATTGDRHLRRIVDRLRTVEAALDPNGTGITVLLDLVGVEAVTSSYVRACIYGTYLLGAASTGLSEYASKQPPLNIYPALTNVDDEVRHELAMFGTAEPGFSWVEAHATRGTELIRVTVHGLIDGPLRETLSLVSKKHPVTAPQLFEAQRRSDVKTTAWNNRLSDLSARRLVRRRREGRAWVYMPIAVEVNVHG